MKDNAPEDSVVDRLRHAVEGAVLPKAARGHAAHLIQRLSSPVRLTLLGPPGAGKSDLVNMFLELVMGMRVALFLGQAF